jgi:hypothetical protein
VARFHFSIGRRRTVADIAKDLHDVIAELDVHASDAHSAEAVHLDMVDHHSTEAAHHRGQQRQAISLRNDLAKLAPQG